MTTSEAQVSSPVISPPLTTLPPVDQREYAFPEKIVVLEHVKVDLLRKSQELLTHFSTLPTEQSPTVLVLLERSAPLAFETAKAQATKKELKLPPIINAQISRDIYFRFSSYLENERDIDLGAVGYEVFPDYTNEFREWLPQDKIAQGVITQLQAQIEAISPPVQSITIVDDTINYGNTLDYVAPIMVELALKGKKLPTTTHALAQNSSWVRDILVANFPFKGGTTENLFLQNVAKGKLELTPQHFELLEKLKEEKPRLKSEVDQILSLKPNFLVFSTLSYLEIGAYLIDKSGWANFSDPFPDLLRKYGNKLLDLPKLFGEALANL
jgi:hypothetical protein